MQLITLNWFYSDAITQNNVEFDAVDDVEFDFTSQQNNKFEDFQWRTTQSNVEFDAADYSWIWFYSDAIAQNNVEFDAVEDVEFDFYKSAE